MNREVNLTKRVQTPRGWRYCRVVLSANGRIKPDLVIFNGKQELHKKGAQLNRWLHRRSLQIDRGIADQRLGPKADAENNSECDI